MTTQLMFPDLEHGVPDGIHHADATTEQLHRTLAMEVQAGVVYLNKDFETVDDLTESRDVGRGILIRARTIDGTWHELIISNHRVPDTVSLACNRSLALDIMESENSLAPPEAAAQVDKMTRLRYGFTITGEPDGFKVPSEARMHLFKTLFGIEGEEDD